MFKSITKGLLVGAMALGFAGTAGATVYEINIYGASAQYKFWNNAADDFHASKLCASSDIYGARDSSKKHGISVCAGQDGFGGLYGAGYNGDNNTYVIRYSSKASYDGIRSVQGLNPDGVDSDCGDDGMRKMADETQTTFPSGSEGVVSGLKCCDVTIGASDVAAETFDQESHGYLLGDDTTSGWEDRSISGLTMDPDYLVYRPVVVPFSFFANVDVPDSLQDNMTRLMAVSLFNGQIIDWDEFLDADDAEYGTGKEVVICMRHAGSGTVATLNAAVMRKDKKLVTTQVAPTDFLHLIGASPVIYFYDGSSDMMNGIQRNAGYADGAAVGYADSDKISDITTPPTSGYTNCVRMNYMGEVGNRSNIVNGLYDFWSAQWLFESDEDPQDIQDLVEDLAEFASDPANIPSANSNWWAAQDEMKWEKSTDYAYPTRK